MRGLLLLVVLCACSTTSPAPETSTEPREVACALSPNELNARREQLLPGLMKRAEQVTDLEDGLRLHFQSTPGLLAEFAQIIESERTCCSFLRFRIDVEPDSGPVTFDMTGPAGTREMLRALLVHAERKGGGAPRSPVRPPALVRASASARHCWRVPARRDELRRA